MGHEDTHIVRLEVVHEPKGSGLWTWTAVVRGVRCTPERDTYETIGLAEAAAKLWWRTVRMRRGDAYGTEFRGVRLERIR